MGKINFRGADPAGLSSIDPEQYRDRFLTRMEELLDVDDMDSTLSQQLGSRQTSQNAESVRDSSVSLASAKQAATPTVWASRKEPPGAL